jgi:hypothetical protein
MLELGVLGGLILILVISIYLLRQKPPTPEAHLAPAVRNGVEGLNASTGI